MGVSCLQAGEGGPAAWAARAPRSDPKGAGAYTLTGALAEAFPKWPLRPHGS